MPDENRHIDGPLQVAVKLAGTELEWAGLHAIRLIEGISMLPEIKLHLDTDQWEGAKDDLASYFSTYLDKKIDIDVGDSELSIKIFKGTVTRIGKYYSPGGEIAQELVTNHAALHELHAYGAFSEFERSLKSTPDFYWDESGSGVNTLVIGGGHAALESMQRNRRCRIFEKKTYDDIIKEVAGDHSLTVSGEKGPTGPMNFVVQYQESDFNFMMRLLKEAGLVYTCFEEGKLELIKKHDRTGSPKIVPEAIWTYAMIKGRALSLKSTVIANDPAKYEIQKGEYDGAALKDRVDSAGNVPGELFETVPEMRDRFDAAKLKSLAEQSSGIGDFYAGQGLIKFRTVDTVVRPGDKVTLQNAGDVHVQSVEHVVEGGAYQCVATAVLAGLPYHIPQQPHVPRIYGPQTAKVVSNMDPEKRDLRVQVQFHWPDEAGTLKPKAWIRVVQPWAGAEHGAQFIPQVGDEVVVEFMNGDPNFPLITGSVYNGKQKVFYPEHNEDKLTTTAIKTRSNELKIDDAKDEELVEITAKKSFHTYANDKKAEIKADDTKINIQHKEKPINVTADADAITVKATQKTILLEAGTSITLKVGQNQIVIDKKGVTIKGMQVGMNSDAGTEVKSSAITTVKGMLVQIN